MNLTFNISHLTLISHLSFNRLSTLMSYIGKLLNGNSLIIDNCKLIIAPERSVL
jgi:hypothetical protein